MELYIFLIALFFIPIYINREDFKHIFSECRPREEDYCCLECSNPIPEKYVFCSEECSNKFHNFIDKK